MDVDLGSEVGAVVVTRQCGDSLDFFQRTGSRIVGECSDGGIQLVDHVREASIRAKYYVARPSAGLQRREGGLMRRQLALLRVEPVRHDFIQSEVADEREAIGGIERNAVGVRSFLTLLVDALARMLNEFG